MAWKMAWLLVLLLLAGAHCQDSDTEEVPADAADGGTPDEGTPDVTADEGAADEGVPDGGAADEGAADEGVPDGGTADEGAADEGVPDGGAADEGAADEGVPDGGAPDEGVPDEGVPDGGTPDEGVPDGGAPDEGVPDGGESPTNDADDGGETGDTGEVAPVVPEEPAEPLFEEGSPCNDGAHKVIDEESRLYRSGYDRMNTIDDKNLDGSSWYRFKYRGKEADVVESSIKPDHCGTQVPFHIVFDNGTKPESNQDGSAKICATDLHPHRPPKACDADTEQDIQVHNCDRFFLYKVDPIDQFEAAEALCITEHGTPVSRDFQAEPGERLVPTVQLSDLSQEMQDQAVSITLGYENDVFDEKEFAEKFDKPFRKLIADKLNEILAARNTPAATDDAADDTDGADVPPADGTADAAGDTDGADVSPADGPADAGDDTDGADVPPADGTADAADDTGGADVPPANGTADAAGDTDGADVPPADGTDDAADDTGAETGVEVPAGDAGRSDVEAGAVSGESGETAAGPAPATSITYEADDVWYIDPSPLLIDDNTLLLVIIVSKDLKDASNQRTKRSADTSTPPIDAATLAEVVGAIKEDGKILGHEVEGVQAGVHDDIKEPTPTPSWTRYKGLFMTLIILLVLIVIALLIGLFCKYCRYSQGSWTRPDEKYKYTYRTREPVIMEEGKKRPVHSVENPLSDDEIKRGESPMYENAPPVTKGSHPPYTKQDEENGWVVPIDQLKASDKAELEDTRL